MIFIDDKGVRWKGKEERRKGGKEERRDVCRRETINASLITRPVIRHP